MDKWNTSKNNERIIPERITLIPNKSLIKKYLNIPLFISKPLSISPV